MNFKKLGNTNLNVSTICLGTMTYGEQNSSNDGFQQMDFALDQGINFFDTLVHMFVTSTSEGISGKKRAIMTNNPANSQEFLECLICLL